MKINKITKSSQKEHTYDIEVEITHNYYVKCGRSSLVSHNSSVCQNATNGMEPPVSLLSYKTSKSASIPFLVPNAKTKGGYYSLAFDIKDNELINKTSGIAQKYLDMSMSVNHYYAYSDYPDGKLPDMVIIKDIISAWKCGLPTIYYAKFDDGDVDSTSGCVGGGCSL